MRIEVPAQFSINDLMAFLQGRGAEGEGLTKDELVSATGRSEGWVGRQLRLLSQAGRLHVAWKSAMRIDGIPCLKPAYSLKRPPEEGNN